MKRGKELTKAQRNAILYRIDCGDSYRMIAESVGCSKSTVGDIIKLYNETDSVAPKKRSGRPHLISGNSGNRFKRLVIKNRQLCTSEVQALWKKKSGQSVSAHTIRRTLYRVGLKNRVARRKPLISASNKAARLAWCLEHASWTKKKWAKVLWSDETSLTQFQQNRYVRVWRGPKDEWDLSCILATIKRSPGRMYWGCFSRKGLGPIVSLQNSVTGESYVKILRKRVLPTIQRMFPNGNYLFQDDNAPPHRSKIAKEYGTTNDLRTLSWPAQSPDLNPIENLWAVLKRSVHNKKTKPRNLNQLDRHVKSAWKAIPVSTLKKLIDSMPRRISAVIEAQGGATKY